MDYCKRRWEKAITGGKKWQNKKFKLKKGRKKFSKWKGSRLIWLIIFQFAWECETKSIAITCRTSWKYTSFLSFNNCHSEHFWTWKIRFFFCVLRNKSKLYFINTNSFICSFIFWTWKIELFNESIMNNILFLLFVTLFLLAQFG